MGDDPEPDSGVSQAAPDDEEPDLPTEGEGSTGEAGGKTGDDTPKSTDRDDDQEGGRAADERTDGAGVDPTTESDDATDATEPDEDDSTEETDDGTDDGEAGIESGNAAIDDGDGTANDAEAAEDDDGIVTEDDVGDATTDDGDVTADDGDGTADDDRLDPDVIPIIEPAAMYGTVRTSVGRIDVESGTAVDETDADVVDTVEERSARNPELVADEATSIEEEARDSIDEGLFGSREGPEEDEEMPLADHIEEMIKRLAVVFVVAGSVSLITFPFADQIITFLWYSVLPGGDVAQPRVYGPLEFLLARIQVASLAGLIVALPVVVYEAYAFMKPGLYRNERKYYLAAIPTSLVLALIGVAFAYFIVLPAIFTYFLAYSEAAGEIAFGLQRTFGLMLILMAYLAVVFQIPLFIMLAIMMGLTTRDWLADKRLYFWGAFLGVAFLSSPDPTGMAPIIIALTMVGLYEGTLFVLKWVGR